MGRGNTFRFDLYYWHPLSASFMHTHSIASFIPVWLVFTLLQLTHTILPSSLVLSSYRGHVRFRVIDCHWDGCGVARDEVDSIQFVSSYCQDEEERNTKWRDRMDSINGNSFWDSPPPLFIHSHSWHISLHGAFYYSFIVLRHPDPTQHI